MWIPLVEYAVKKGVSLSTLRRYIKAGKVEFRVEAGKYLIFAPPEAQSPLPDDSKFNNLMADLRSAQEEIAELKMLVAIYEEKFSNPAAL